MRIALAAAVLLLFGASDAHAVTVCKKTSALPRFDSHVVAIRAQHGDVERTAVVLCDRRAGRRLVLRRATLNEAFTGRDHGTLITDTAVAGLRAAWTEISGRARAWTVRRVLIALPQRRVVRRWQERSFSERLFFPEIALSAGGDIAWTGRDDLVLLSPGRAPRTVAGDVDDIGFEDRGTLRWFAPQGRFQSLDFRAPEIGDRCPVRTRFHTVLSNGEAVVTRADYKFGSVGVEVVRACDRATGRDPVVAQTSTFEGEGEFFSSLMLRDRWLVVVVEASGKFRQGEPENVRTVDARGALAGVRGQTPPYSETGAPDERKSVVVTDRGTPVWLTGSRTDRLVAITTAGELTTLDEGPPGTIRVLRAVGTEVRWANGGESRSADVP